MSDSENGKPIPLIRSDRVYAFTRNATERHLGRTLRAMYDALPAQPPSRRLAEVLHRIRRALTGASR
jgi:hypothetical protein